MTPAVVREIGTKAFDDALEIVTIIQVLQVQNTRSINQAINENSAARAAVVVRNGLLTRLVLLTSGPFAPVSRDDDRHLRVGIDAMLRKETREIIERTGGSQDKSEQLFSLWRKLDSDPNRQLLKTFRDKHTAHRTAATIIPDGLNYSQLYELGESVSRLMETFSHASGARKELLDEQLKWALESSENFWRPWMWSETWGRDQQ